MSAPHPRRLGAIAFALSAALAATGTLLSPVAHATGTAPSIRLVAGATTVTIKRSPGRRAYLNIGAYVAAVNGAFEIWAQRPDYDTPVSVSQVVRSGDSITKIPLPSWVQSNWVGLSKFVQVTVTDSAGNVVLDRYHPFCPGSGELARVSDDGPAVATYPQFCGGNPFTLGAVWGIDSGWSSNIFGYGTTDSIKGPDGVYTATVSIAPNYQSLFGVAPSDASVSIGVTVKTTRRGACVPFCAGGTPIPVPAGRAAARAGGRSGIGGRASASVPIMTNPDPSITPDLIALPAWGITIDRQRKTQRDYLDFGATVWDKGPSPMVVEGFRRPGDSVMDGWEYFYSNGVAVGRAPAGGLMYDARPGHQHWHFEQFARYSLLGADQTQVVMSQKMGFCLAATDAIDLTTPGAEWNPYSTGFGTACSGQNAIWMREVLPAGWGDTYFQGLPGQSFDITDVPNGVYYISVQANPEGLLIEGNTTNNTELRKVILGGTPGDRTVRVPAWHGIDTDPGGGRGVITSGPVP